MTKYINHNNLLPIEPIGPSQEKAFKAYEDDKNLFLSGAAGTGKTFILLYLAFKSVFNKEDEAQNMIFQELDTVISRVGQNSKIMFSGDTAQTAFTQNSDKDGYLNFITILSDMVEFSVISFGIGDILRSGLVRSYLIEKEKFGIKQLDA